MRVFRYWNAIEDSIEKQSLLGVGLVRPKASGRWASCKVAKTTVAIAGGGGWKID